MAAVEIVGFAVAWLLVALALAWSLVARSRPIRRSGLADRVRSGGPRIDVRRALRLSDVAAVTDPGSTSIDLRRIARPASSGDAWVTVETLEGVGADVVVVGEVLLSAALVTRGFDPAALSASDVRIETASDIDGSQVTRFLVRAQVLSRPAPS